MEYLKNRMGQLFGGCSHGDRAFPVKGRQSCLGCGASRMYLFGRRGLVIGRWRKAVR